MARFVKGDVVVVPFPFSDLSPSRRRPALVVAELPDDELVLCQVTSQSVRDAQAVMISDGDFQSGSLQQTGNIRPNRLFTADQSTIVYRLGQLKPHVVEFVIARLKRLF